MKTAVEKDLTQRLEYITEGDSLERKKELMGILDIMLELDILKRFWRSI